MTAHNGLTFNGDASALDNFQFATHQEHPHHNESLKKGRDETLDLYSVKMKLQEMQELFNVHDYA